MSFDNAFVKMCIDSVRNNKDTDKVNALAVFPYNNVALKLKDNTIVTKEINKHYIESLLKRLYGSIVYVVKKDENDEVNISIGTAHELSI